MNIDADRAILHSPPGYTSR